MTKTEAAMVEAILQGRQWQRGETSVSYDRVRQQATVRVHGEVLAVRDKRGVKLQAGTPCLARFRRLQALVDEFGDGEALRGSKGQWLLEKEGSRQPVDGAFLREYHPGATN